MSRKRKVRGFKSREDFEQDSYLLTPAATKFYQIHDFNFSQKIFNLFTTLNSRNVKNLSLTATNPGGILTNPMLISAYRPEVDRESCYKFGSLSPGEHHVSNSCKKTYVCKEQGMLALANYKIRRF